MSYKRVFLQLNVTMAFLFAASGSILSQDIKTALKLMQSERYEDAEAIFQQIIKTEPANGDAYFYCGENILKNYIADPYSNTLEDVAKEATAIFTDGLKNDSLNVLNQVGLGMVVLLQKNDTAKADVYFKKAELSLPKKAKKFTEANVNTLIKLGIAQLYATSPRYNKAIAYLEKAKEAAPDNTDIYIALGDIYVDQNNASTAVTNYNKAVYLNPKLTVPKVKIGNLYMRSRNLTEARNYFEQAKEIDSTFAPLYRGLGEMYSLGGLANLSKTNFKKFLDLSGNNIPAKVQYVNSLFKAKDYKEAIANIEEILNYDKSRNYLYRIAAYSCYEMRPGDYAMGREYIETFFKNAAPEKIIVKDYAYYGRILLKLKDTSVIDLAFEKLLTAYKMDTTDFDLVSDIAINAYFSRRFPLASEMLNKKIENGKASTTDYMYLGKTYYQMAQAEKSDTLTASQIEQYKNAESVFTKITEMEPDNMQAYLWIANTYASMDPETKEGLARPKYETVIEKAMADTVKYAKELYESYSYMGSLYLFSPKPDYNKAEVFYNKLINLDPKNNLWKIKGYSSLGIIDTKRKRYADAIGRYKKVLELDPKNDNSQKAIDGLQKAIKAQQQQQ